MTRLRGHFDAERSNSPDGDYHVANTSVMNPSGDPGLDERADESYRLISIDAVGAPEGCTGSDWHIYRIAQGENGITGYRHGELASVTADVETIVTALNGRRQWTKSKALSKHQRSAAAAARRAAVR